MLNYNVKIDYYQILELSPTATSGEIKKAYRKLALKTHPDKGGDQERFKAVADAYEILIDEPTRTDYDTNRSIDSNLTSSGNSNSHNNAVKSKMVFHSTYPVTLSENTSLVVRTNKNNVVSTGIKAEDMSLIDLFNLAMAAEPVALALAKDMEQLKRFANEERGFYKEKLWQLALKHPSFTYQIVACSESKPFLYGNYFSSYLSTLLKNDYNLLLLIASSDELIKAFFYHNEKSLLNGTQLHEIYDFHLKNRHSCRAFELLLETNEPLNNLFNNRKTLLSTNGCPEFIQLETLDCNELRVLALKDKQVAIQVFNNSELLNKFKFSRHGLFDLISAYPGECNHVIFNKLRAWNLDGYDIKEGCKKSFAFLLCILNWSKESELLNGCDLEEIMESHPQAKDYIYNIERLKNKHNSYGILITLLTANDFSIDTYTPILTNIGSFNQFNLLSVLRTVSNVNPHKNLAINSALLMDSCNWKNSYCLYEISGISIAFFEAIYNNASLRAGYKENTYKLCEKYDKAFEFFCQDVEALDYISDEQIYELQQKWVKLEKNKIKLSEIFNKNPGLMRRWYQGYNIKKLHRDVAVSEYEDQKSLNMHTESEVDTSSTLSSLQQYLMFFAIKFDESDDLNTLVNKISLLALEKKIDIYLDLLNKNHLTLVDVFKNRTNISLLRDSEDLQKYFIAHYEAVKEDLIEIVNSCCKQHLFGDALTIFSLLYQLELENNIHTPLPNYVESQKKYPYELYSKMAIFIGSAGLVISAGLAISLGSISIALSLAMAASALLVAFGLYGLYNPSHVYEEKTISYKEALSRNNVSLFFKEQSPLQSDSFNVESSPCLPN